MKLRAVTLEHLLWTAAILLAFGVRFLNLGAAPLSDEEARWALQALDAARGGGAAEAAVWGPHPAYISLTGAAFAVFGSTNFIARLWPALAGSLLVLLPLFFRAEFSRVMALVIGFGIALDPGLTAASRIAAGPIMAVSFAMLAFGAWYSKHPIWAGIFAGLALLSGPAVFLGLLGLVLAWSILKLLGGFQGQPDPDAGESGLSWTNAFSRRDLLTGLAACGIVVAAVATLFLRHPQGLAAWSEALTAFLAGWAGTPAVSALRLLYTLVIYQPLAVIFGLVAVVQLLFDFSWREREGVVSKELSIISAFRSSRVKPLRLEDLFSLWTGVMFLLVMLYPARESAYLTWVLVPLWILAASRLTRYLPAQNPEQNWISSGHALLVFILLALLWLNLPSIGNGIVGEGGRMVLAIIAGIFALIGLTTVLVTLGWSWPAGRNGLAWGLAAALGAYMLSAMWGAAHLRPNDPRELWIAPPTTGQAALLLDTLHDLSLWETGVEDAIEIESTVDTPAMRWLLRSFENARFTSWHAAGQQPPVIVTPQNQEAPTLAAAYRGQDFAWRLAPGWQGALPPNPILWLVFREAPVSQESVIVWARSDLFPHGAAESQSSENP